MRDRRYRESRQSSATEVSGGDGRRQYLPPQALDPVVFERTWSEGEIAYRGLAQVAADCLTGPDRMPAEGEALLEWMAAKEESWRLDG
jgi:hypothetical protein